MTNQEELIDAITLEIAETLEDAARLLEPSDRWTQGAYARYASGCAAAIMSSNAVAFCAEGAIHQCTGGTSKGWQVHNVFNAFIKRTLDPGGIAEYNDACGRTKTDVVRALYQCAAELRGTI